MGEFEEKKINTEQTDVPKKRDYEKELIAIIKSGEPPQVIRKKLEDYHENDIASVWEELTKEERIKFYQLLGNETISEIFTYLEDDVSRYLEELGLENAADILESMDADDAVDILDEMEDEKSDRLIQLMDAESRHDINLIQSYEDDEIGSKMTTNFIVIRRGLTIPGAMKELVAQAADNDNISTLYVIDENESFCGAIDLKDLIIARKYTALEDVITTSYPYVYAKESIDECIEDLKDYSEDSIPVLDNDKKILGVITAQDIVEVVDEEMGEDYAKLAGLTAEEDLNEPLLESMKKRIPWLLLLMISATFTGRIITSFEDALSSCVVLTAFIPMLMDTGGNAGGQASVTIIRGLSLNEITFGDMGRVIWKESRVALLCGITLAAANFIKLLFLDRVGMAVAAVVCLTLAVTVFIAKLVGCSLPMFAKKIGFDPAVMASPFITTIVDAISLMVYFQIAATLLHL